MKHLFFLFFIPLSIFSQSTKISELRNNDSNGIPVDTGKVFTISGVVTSSNHFGYSGPGSIQDSTGGISIYGNGFASSSNIGDSVTVTASLAQFRGLSQLNFNSSSTLIKHNANSNIDTLVLTIQEIKSQNWNGFEEYESRLIRINNVKIEAQGSFSSGSNYLISDVTGSLTDGLRIDNDVKTLIGTPIPTNNVDIIGILGQYKSTVPFNSGYQLIPRFKEDILTDGTPLIYNSVYVSKLDTNSFTVKYTTSKLGNTHIKFGFTENLELDSVVINEEKLNHEVTVSELNESTKYYFKVFSENAYGRSSSNLYNVLIPTANPETGAINVYFNFPVDTTVAIPGNSANGNINFVEKIIQRINAASNSIDMAVYSFSGLDDVANALISATNRGVKVRVVYHNRTTQNSMQLLIDAGIKVQKRTDNDGLMHNKFLIFDGRDENLKNDWVWTGSWNLTSTELKWKNNVIEINDPSLALAYQNEFEEMWGGNGDVPNSNSRFGINKFDNTVHTFQIGGRKIESFFSPSDATESKIIDQVKEMNHSIYFATLTFTSDGISNSIKNSHLYSTKDIRGIIDNVEDMGGEYNNFKNYTNEVFDYNLDATLHHKYGIIDASFGSSDPVVITGSHNWSKAANEINDENTLIIHDLYIANQFMQEFKKRYNESGGTVAFVIPVVTSLDSENNVTPESVELFQNYPNPFNPVTTISFYLNQNTEIELSVYNTLGEKVASIFNGEAKSGKNFFDFNASNLSSGIYFYQLKSSQFNLVKKLLILK